ncbi:MAG: alpha/beta fold hydrolase [Rehaibacterium terrae]|uniref:alpha/beta fold hydrolase n=1 Tax=Rehaibacterium terrae TaxID=1341696 RepID=UPI0039188A29
MDAVCRFRAADGVELGYRRWRPRAERGMPLVLLHGAASNGTRWWHFVATTTLRHGHRLIRPDLRGHGLSLWRGPADMARWSDDLAELLDQERIARAHIGGHCLGANLALHFAARHPGRCAGLVLIEPMVRSALVGTLARLRPLTPLLRLLVALLRGGNRLGLHRRHLRPLDLEALDRSVQGAIGSSAMLRRYGSPWHDLRTLPSAQYLANLLEVLRPLPLARVRSPGLAVLSRGRLMADPARTRAALAILPGIEFVELDARHWIPTEQPDAMRECIDAWVLAHDATQDSLAPE